MALAVPAVTQDATLARLEHDTVAEVTQPRVGARAGSGKTISSHGTALSDSVLSRSAAIALFVKGDLVRARQLSKRAWQRDHGDAEAIFVQMEAASMQADEASMLNAALRLCDIGGAATQDPRVRLAAARVREAAANTPEFLAIIPGVQKLLANSDQDWPELNAALLQAAMDGVPTLNADALARASGILTEWRIVGPVGRRQLLDFEQPSISPNDDLTQASYGNRAVENFDFPDGIISLPSYLPSRGTYYAASHFASLTAGTWIVRFESVGALEIYVDGERVLRQNASLRGTHVRGLATVEVAAGPHRVMVKFPGAAAPFRDCSVAFNLRRHPPHRGRSCRRRRWLTNWLLHPTPAGSSEPRSSKSVRGRLLPIRHRCSFCWPSRGCAAIPRRPKSFRPGTASGCSRRRPWLPIRRLASGRWQTVMRLRRPTLLDMCWKQRPPT